MKPLELTVYPRDEDGDYFHSGLDYYIPDVDVDYWTECKRLTDAELAAEYWAEYAEVGELAESCHPHYDETSPRWPQLQQAEARRHVLERFATHPHALEAS